MMLERLPCVSENRLAAISSKSSKHSDLFIVSAGGGGKVS